MHSLDPTTFCAGKILVAAPHMDDEILGCGGTLLQIPRKERIHVVYTTDGQSQIRGRAAPPGKEDLGALRRAEARAALAELGIPEANVHFLDFPESQLKRAAAECRLQLDQLIRALEPDAVFAPFRFDRNPDHLALNRIVRALREQARRPFETWEYFVYWQWKLLPRGDIRAYLRPDCLWASDIRAVADRKRRLLEKFVSQTTLFYPWQYKPVLGPALLDQFCAGPEYFLRLPPDSRERDLFTLPLAWVRLIHTVEPRLKNLKESILERRH
jgi:LmbE family N-acetylglucosaminyl deacetylase